MRWLAACLVVIASMAAFARAKIVIMEPAIVRTCQRAPSWDAVSKCLTKLGRPTVVRTLPGAKLVQLQEPGGDAATYDAGLSLYMSDGKQWRLAGLFEPRGGDYELLDAAPLTVGKHSGVRVDIGEVLRTSVSLDGVQSQPAVMTMHRAMFCGGDSWRCPEVITTCDVLVRGAAVWSFHGTVSISDNQVHVTGPRTHGGAMCDVAESELLGWSQP